MEIVIWVIIIRVYNFRFEDPKIAFDQDSLRMPRPHNMFMNFFYVNYLQKKLTL